MLHVASSDDAFNHLFGHGSHMRIDWHFPRQAAQLGAAWLRKAGLPIKPQALTAYAIPREDRAATPVVEIQRNQFHLAA